MNVEIVGGGRNSLLVLPGWRLDSETEKPDWEPVINDRDGWRALFVDLPGTGRSRDDHARIETQRDILHAVAGLAENSGLGQGVFAVAGKSNGGALALALAHRYPSAVQGVAVGVPMVLNPGSSSGQARLG
jgi:pimeloyl-ACP methyl ester carboxylesterase